MSILRSSGVQEFRSSGVRIQEGRKLLLYEIRKRMQHIYCVGANGETLSLGGFPDLRKVSNPKGGSPL